MKLYLTGHSERYALEQLQMTLFPEETMEYLQTPLLGMEGAISKLSVGKIFTTASAKITQNGKVAKASRRLKNEEITLSTKRRILQQSYYLAAIELLGQAPPWGATAGVRPSKITSKILLNGGTEKECDAVLRDVYYVSPARRTLCLDASKSTLEASKLLLPTDISLYIGIPFCPTRCSYCSFVSQSISKQGQLLAPFLDALIEEIAYTGKLLASSPFTIRTVYMGGGTPTTFSAQQMGRLMDAINTHFDLSRVIEYTVEGGRPDTLNEEKLCLIREKGANRMSINPQTMDDEILTAIGRNHTAQMTLDAYDMAKRAGFEGINMDLIAGLPTDTVEGFAKSLHQCMSLAPTNLTIHTLAIKKGSDLHKNRENLLSAKSIQQIMDDTERTLREGGYEPYYLYRQKYISGSFENVGWCKKDFMGLYNIYMMEELHTILSVGGGGMNKINLPNGRIERFHNPKYPKDYLDRLEDTLATRKNIFEILRV